MGYIEESGADFLLIDLHSHTDASDGTFSPSQLIDEAVRVGVRVLGVTDHDTFDGYDAALPLARHAGVELVCGIELSTKLHGRSVHLLGYFLSYARLRPFREWILDMQAARRDRNERLIERLQSLGFDITLEEVQARGRGLTHGLSSRRSWSLRATWRTFSRRLTAIWTNPQRVMSTGKSHHSPREWR
jgi:hypothetical protein